MKKLISYLLLLVVMVFNISCEKQNPSPEPEPVTIPQVFDLVGQLQLTEGPHDLAVNGNYLFACRNDIISVIDLTNPSTPILMNEINDFAEVNNFESLVMGDNNILYAGCTSIKGIYMINVSNPASPQIIGKFNADIYVGNKLSPYKLFYTNSILFAGGSNGANALLVKYNVINSNSLQMNDYWVSSSTGNGIGGVWTNSTNTYISTADGMVYSFGNNTISSGPIGSYTFINEPGHGHGGKSLFGIGNKLYWADWGAGFATINISDPTNLVTSTILTNSGFIAQFPDAEGTDVYDMAYNPTTGKLFVANGWSGLLRIDANNSGIVEDFVDYQYYANYCVELLGDNAILGNISGGISSTEKGIKIIKIQ